MYSKITENIYAKNQSIINNEQKQYQALIDRFKKKEGEVWDVWAAWRCKRPHCVGAYKRKHDYNKESFIA